MEYEQRSPHFQDSIVFNTYRRWKVSSFVAVWLCGRSAVWDQVVWLWRSSPLLGGWQLGCSHFCTLRKYGSPELWGPTRLMMSSCGADLKQTCRLYIEVYYPQFDLIIPMSCFWGPHHSLLPASFHVNEEFFFILYLTISKISQQLLHSKLV